MTGADILARRGITAEPEVAPGPARFPDGARFRAIPESAGSRDLAARRCKT
jgi:hypothetical protein